MVIKDENYIVIHGWMRTKLGLNGNDLIVYAVLYGFSQDGESEFRGTLNYISNFSGSSEATVRRSLQFLEGNGYIKRLNRNLEDGKSNGYVCIPLDEMIGVSKCNPPGIKMQPPGYQNATPRVSKCNPYQTLDNKEEYITSDKEDYMKERKKENNIYINNNKDGGDLLSLVQKMSDEEFIAWAGTPVDANDPQFWDILEVCEKETKRRGKVKEWTGKVVRTQGKIQRLESHEQVMDNFGVSEELKVKVKAFLRYCWANGHLKTNEMLEDILFTLDRTYESDDDKIGAIEKAMRQGFYDIKRYQ